MRPRHGSKQKQKPFGLVCSVVAVNPLVTVSPLVALNPFVVRFEAIGSRKPSLSKAV